MTQMIGADVGQLRELAKQFHRNADELETIASRLQSTSRAVWTGPDAGEYFADVETSLSPRLRQTAQALRTAGDAASRNAQDQEQTSATLDGGSSSGFGTSTPEMGSTTSGSAGQATDISDGLWNLLGMAGSAIGIPDDVPALLKSGKLWENIFADADSMVPKWLGTAGTVAGVLQGFKGIWDAADDFREGKTFDAMYGLAKTGLGAIPKVGTVVGLAIDAIELGIPVTGDQAQKTLDSYAMRTFGTTDLTPEQQFQVSDRYNGPMGFVSMLTDTVQSRVDQPETLIDHGIAMLGKDLPNAIFDAYDSIRGLQ